jgi:hypothetical protein
MNTHNHSTYQPDMPVEIGMDSIDLREVQANDHLLFWTQRSCYSFRVTDAADFRGQLSRSGEQAALPPGLEPSARQRGNVTLSQQKSGLARGRCLCCLAKGATNLW